MELYKIILLCLVILLVVVGGYVYMMLHIMRSDPKEIDYREQKGQNNSIVPGKDKDNKGKN